MRKMFSVVQFSRAYRSASEVISTVRKFVRCSFLICMMSGKCKGKRLSEF